MWQGFLNYLDDNNCLSGTGSGILFFIGGSDLKYANIALKSSSESFPIPSQGIGGSIGLPAPRGLPVLNALINISGCHVPIPVSLSGVRLAEYEEPQGPIADN